LRRLGDRLDDSGILYCIIKMHGFLSVSAASGKKFASIVLFMIFSDGLSHRLPNLLAD
jgi:hypothetical protein